MVGRRRGWRGGEGGVEADRGVLRAQWLAAWEGHGCIFYELAEFRDLSALRHSQGGEDKCLGIPCRYVGRIFVKLRFVIQNYYMRSRDCFS
jgi:hypothetical protein